MKNLVIYVMGVSGSGKSTIGKLLAEEFGCPFYDGDDYHSERNIRKMKSGRALNDEDRNNWLLTLNKLAVRKSQNGRVVIGCSALKEKYRQILQKEIEDACLFIFLKGDFEAIHQRMKNRNDHFMPAKLLRSQFETLEEPDYGIHVEAGESPEESVEYILNKMKL